MSLDQIGPLARDVHGLSLLMECIAGLNPKEGVMLEGVRVSYGDLERGVEGMRVGICPQFFALTDPRINEVIERRIEELRDLGAKVEEVSIPHLEHALSAYYLIVSVEFFSATRRFDGRKYGKRIEEVCGEEVLRRIAIGSYISRKEYRGKYYQRALQLRTLIRKEFSSAFEKVEVLVGPTVPKLPHRLGQRLSPLEMYAYDYLTVPANLAGICAGVVRGGEVDGIPVGIQVQGPPLGEEKVLRVMRALEVMGCRQR